MMIFSTQKSFCPRRLISRRTHHKRWSTDLFLNWAGIGAKPKFKVKLFIVFEEMLFIWIYMLIFIIKD